MPPCASHVNPLCMIIGNHYLHTMSQFDATQQHPLMNRHSNETSSNRKQGSISYTYIHTYIHTYIRTYVRTYIHTYIHTYIYTYIHTYIHTNIHTYIHTCIHTCMHTYIHACMHAYIHACIHTYMHACIHACMHTHIQPALPLVALDFFLLVALLENGEVLSLSTICKKIIRPRKCKPGWTYSKEILCCSPSIVHLTPFLDPILQNAVRYLVLLPCRDAQMCHLETPANHAPKINL